MRYNHLTLNDRNKIEVLNKEGYSSRRIAKMLEIKDENISIQAVEAKKYKNYYCHMIYSTLTYIPHACECCGHINTKQAIVKNFQNNRIKCLFKYS